MFGDNPDLDEAIVKAVREELGEGFELQIDLASKWRTYGHSAYMMKRLEKYNLNWVEEPVLADDLDGYAKLSGITSAKFRAENLSQLAMNFRNF